MENEVCNFSKAWIGNCTEIKPCSKHSKIKCCACGEPATRECEHTAILVCGAPLCENCFAINLPPDKTKPNWFGLSGHQHVKPIQGHTKGFVSGPPAKITCSCGWTFNMTGKFSDLNEWDLHFVSLMQPKEQI
jgi:hypothetical protein